MASYFSFIQDDFFMLTTKKTNLSFDDLKTEIFNELNIKKNNLVRLGQTHSNNIICTDNPGFYDNYDGIIISGSNNLIPVIATADCVPLFIYDNKKNIYSLIHCGWRGVVSKIHLKAIDAFINKGSEMKNIKFYLGPSIQSCCYEIGEDIVGDFRKNSITHFNKKIYLNLFKEISSDFFNSGVDQKNIKYSSICTFENELCYSYRRDGSSKGRMFSMIVKK